MFGFFNGYHAVLFFPDVENAEEGEHDGLINIYTVLRGSNTCEVKFLIFLVLRQHAKHVLFILVCSGEFSQSWKGSWLHGDWLQRPKDRLISI